MSNILNIFKYIAIKQLACFSRYIGPILDGNHIIIKSEN